MDNALDRPDPTRPQPMITMCTVVVPLFVPAAVCLAAMPVVLAVLPADGRKGTAESSRFGAGGRTPMPAARTAILAVVSDGVKADSRCQAPARRAAFPQR